MACLLQSSRAVVLHVKRPAQHTDHEYESLKQKMLWLAVNRQCALSVGRGAFTFASSQTAEVQSIGNPQLVLAARFPPSSAVSSYVPSAQSSESLIWPEFLNGCSSALQLYPLAGELSDANMIRGWVLNCQAHAFRKLETPNAGGTVDSELWLARHAGFFYGAGLQGILRTMCRLPQAKACKTTLEFGPVEIQETWNQNLISLPAHRSTTEVLGELNVLAQEWFPRDDPEFVPSEYARFAPPCKKPHLSYLYGNHTEDQRKSALDYIRQSTPCGFGMKFEGGFLTIQRTGGGGLGWPQGVDAVKHWKEVARCKLGGEPLLEMGDPKKEAEQCPDMKALKGL